MKLIVTTTHTALAPDANMTAFLEESNFPYCPRERQSLKQMIDKYDADGVIVWQEGIPVLYIEDEKLFFHPSMARVRLAAYRKLGTPDPMAQACQFEPDYRFLDCTMGLGADCIVASYFLNRGRVVGLESSPGIAHVIKWGMKGYKCNQEWLMSAINRINVVNINHLAYLKTIPDSSFDIVYFDPMFRKPLLKSQPISPLRALADHSPINIESIREACRVASKRVVIKERRGSGEIERLGFAKRIGSRHNNIVFGVIEV